MNRRERFLHACRREPVDATPIWFMRQAGRFLPGYRALRARHSVLELAKTPELSAQVTQLPLKELDVDAAIIFADIMLPLEPMGVALDIPDDVGPVIQDPIRSSDDVDRLTAVNPRRDLGFVLDALRILKTEIDGERALIGFSGAPFTLASYLVEGGPSRRFLKTKFFMHKQPQAWHRLMEKLSVVVGDYLDAQVHAGADALQLFDSWVGCLSPQDYAEFVAPYSSQVLSRPFGVPTIHFGTNSGDLLGPMAQAGGDVIGVDWRTPLDEASRRTGPAVALQGNLDPAVLAADAAAAKRAASEILRRVAGRPGHIFNLGHGVLPETPVDNARQLVDHVHEESRRAQRTVPA
jgi:uroporphyrinogen decarboxylase